MSRLELLEKIRIETINKKIPAWDDTPAYFADEIGEERSYLVG